MQWTNFKGFVIQVIHEGRRLERYDVNGRLLTKRMSFMQIVTLFLALISPWLLPRGFPANFSGYMISFLGIFIGLFSSSIMVALYERSTTIFRGYKQMDQEQKVRTKQLRNYLIQFTGLTGYAILIAIVLVILLSFALLGRYTQDDLSTYRFIESRSQLGQASAIAFTKAVLLISHRAATSYLLLRFFTITIFATSSYFTFLLSEYKKINLDD